LGVAAFLAGVFLAEPTFLVATVFFTFTDSDSRAP
jgi:hypothetical protein